MNAKVVVVLSQDRRPQSGQRLLENKLADALARREGVVVILSPHLYDLTMEGRGVALLRAIPGDMIVLAWLYPRAAYWVLDAHGVRGRLGYTSSLPEEDRPAADRRPGKPRLPERTIWCFDLRHYPRPEPLLDEIDRILDDLHGTFEVEQALGGAGQVRRIEEQTQARWYPVIDYSRCNHCLECLNFCLFGVFSVDPEKALQVEQPDACRDGCPACSRICPQGAIMFPEHSDPAIAGDPQASRAPLKLDLSQIFSGQTPADLAAAERARALAEQQAADGQTKPADDLDQLVDRLDQLDLD